MSNLYIVYGEKINKSQFAEKSLNVMWEYWKEEKLCDITLIAGIDAISIKAHRLVLAAASQYFSDMFGNDLKKSEVFIKDITGHVLKAFIEYSYKGVINICMANVQIFLSQATRLLYNDIAKACENFLITQLDDSNCFTITSIPEYQKCDRLLKAAKEYRKRNFATLVQGESFLQLSLSEVCDFLSEHDTEPEVEKIAFRAAIAWVNNDLESRQRELPKLLSVIRLHVIEFKFLLEDAANILVENKECMKILLETLKEKTEPKLIIGALEGIYALNLSNNKFKTLYKTPEQLINKMSRIGNKLILMGLGEDFCEVKSLSLVTGNWEKLSSSPHPKLRSTVVEFNTDIYAIGGFDSNGLVEKFDSMTNEWTTIACMNPDNFALIGHSAAVLNEKIFVIGGFNNDEMAIDKVKCYDPISDTWSSCAAMVTARVEPAVVVANNHLFVFGGYSGSECLDSIEKYNPETNTWTIVSKMTKDHEDFDAYLFGSKIIIIGSSEMTDITMEEFDPTTNECKLLSTFQNPDELRITKAYLFDA